MMNRGFLYGDGFFETIRIVDQNVPLNYYHVERILDGFEIYDMEPQFTIDEELILSTAKNYGANGIFRMNFFREGFGTYLPDQNEVAFNHSYKEASHDFFLPTVLDLAAELNKAPLFKGNYGFYDKPKPMVDWLTVKSLSSIYYVLASKKKEELNLDYLFITNDKNEICEEVSSNIILMNGTEDIIVPHPKCGGVHGATQRYILGNYGFQLDQKLITRDDIENADKVFLTRGTRGVFRIK